MFRLLRLLVSRRCRLVSLGEMMKHLASQIKRLVLAIITLMTSSMQKLSSLHVKDIGIGDFVDIGKITDNAGGVVNVGKIKDSVEDVVGDAVDGAVDKMKDKFGKFWK
jgi:hypothetical protein